MKIMLVMCMETVESLVVNLYIIYLYSERYLINKFSLPVGYRWLKHVVGGQITKYRFTTARANVRICPTTHVLISNDSPVGEIISILKLYRMRMQGYCVVCKWTIFKRTSPGVKCLHPTSSRRKMCTTSVSNVI